MMQREYSTYKSILEEMDIENAIATEQDKFLKDHKFNCTYQNKSYVFLIKVPCEKRLSCYEEYLNKIALAMLELFNNAKSKVFDLDLSLIISKLIQDFSSILDREIMYCLDKEIALYREKNNINCDMISPEQSVVYLTDFFSKFKEKKFKEHMQENYLRLFLLYERITKNFIKNTSLAFNRILADFDAYIIPAFFSASSRDTIFSASSRDTNTTIKLTNISLAGDLHKKGQQVLILHFTQAGKEISFIYKPSPIYLDALVVGDTSLLTKLWPNEFKHKFSLVDILNEHIKNSYTDNQQFLPTYTIIPRIDNSKTSTMEESRQLSKEYGYLSFISVKPFNHPNGNWLFELACRQVRIPGLEQLQEDKAKEQSQENREQKYFDLYFINMLNKAIATQDCNYITRDKNKVKLHSFINGIYAGLLTLFGGADLHADNKIGDHLIDLECFFTQQNPSLREMICLNSEQGAMHGDSLISEEYTCLYDISGIKVKNIKILAKNHLFFYDKNKQMLQSCQPDSDIFLHGYKILISTLTKKCSKLVREWFEWVRKINPYVRVVPYPTGTFYGDIKILRKNNFIPGIIGPNGIGKKEHLKNLGEYQSKKQTDTSIFVVEPLPKISVYCEENIADTIQQLINLNIPVYYARVDERELYNALGKTIIVPKDFRSIPEIATDFYREPPLVFIQSRYNWLLSKNNRKILYTQTKKEVKKLLSETERALVPNFLMKLPNLYFSEEYGFPQLKSKFEQEQKMISSKSEKIELKEPSDEQKEKFKEEQPDSDLEGYTFME